MPEFLRVCGAADSDSSSLLAAEDGGRSGRCAVCVCVQTDDQFTVVSIYTHTQHHCGQSVLLLPGSLHRPRRHLVPALHVADGVLDDPLFSVLRHHRPALPAVSVSGLCSGAALNTSSDGCGDADTHAAASIPPQAMPF
ncbi:uncharacterized protein LOC130237615 isoform X2 [Danio aesculapii]|uniref:uncharacterized protein LOC130237615 isoform X2 n=1 Tax=Danio aesculapii TaxID=1142201 RepID=UPI0024BF4FF1|nr:uncharacterized protein LOC130237615 isoform X2 [Danio aesculapii]